MSFADSFLRIKRPKSSNEMMTGTRHKFGCVFLLIFNVTGHRSEYQITQRYACINTYSNNEGDAAGDRIKRMKKKNKKNM